MKTVSLASFLADADALVQAAAIDEDALRIDTGSGSAVLISEAEWLVLRDGLKLALGASDPQ
jgi:PHD/YefM family antitoxin component YafN of YafNO toxin-antitoxin module